MKLSTKKDKPRKSWLNRFSKQAVETLKSIPDAGIIGTSVALTLVGTGVATVGNSITKAGLEIGARARSKEYSERCKSILNEQKQDNKKVILASAVQKS